MKELIETIRPINGFPEGTVTPPPSKSLSHRAVICAALSEGESVIHNIALSDDIKATIEGVKTLGAEVRFEGDCLYVRGGILRQGGLISSIEAESSRQGEWNSCTESGNPPQGVLIDCTESGNPPQGVLIDCIESGTTLRFLIPLAALRDRETIFEGRGRLLERPMNVYNTVFNNTSVIFIHDNRQIKVRGPLQSGIYTLPGDVSSQFVSGMLLALPLVSGDSEIRLSSNLESEQYVRMTVDVMRRFGVEIDDNDPWVYRIRGDQKYTPVEYTVEADYSQAAFFLCAAALGRDVRCAGLNRDSIQGDSFILTILGKMGANITWEEGMAAVSAGSLRGLTFDAGENPDLVPPIAATCCFCEGTSRIVNAGRLRIKESDRLHALAVELARLGADIVEEPNSLIIHGKTSIDGGEADSHNDHRIAMAIAIAAIRCKGQVKLSGWSSVNKSYPTFWEDFEKSQLCSASE